MLWFLRFAARLRERLPWEFVALATAALVSREFIGFIAAGISLLVGSLAVYLRRQELARVVRNRRASAERRRLDEVYAQLVEIDDRVQRRCQQVTDLEQEVSDAQEESSILKAQIADEAARCRLAEARVKGECNDKQTAIALALSDERSRRAVLASALDEEKQRARSLCLVVDAERRKAWGASQQIADFSMRAEMQEALIRKESDRVATLQQRLEEAEQEASTGQSRVVELIEQVTSLKAKLDEHPMSQVAGWFGFTAEVSAQDEQARQPAGPESIKLCQASVAREAITLAKSRATKLRSELERLERMAATTQGQREELHCRCESLRREAEDLSDDIRDQQNLLDRQRLDSQEAEKALREEQRRCQALVDELHAAQHQVRPRDAVESIGHLLRETIANEPPESRPTIKAKLLNCFHPGKNPAADVATRITRMLESMD